MNANFRLISFIAFLCTLFISCQKELGPIPPLETAATGGMDSGTARFILTGAPNTCTHYLIGGTYFTGTEMGSTNVVALAVNVTDTGSYFLSTAVINGISFSGSGHFDSTGQQTIMLKATGTPLSAGSFDYKPAVNCCSFSITVRPNDSAAAVGVLDCAHASSTGVYQHGVSLDSSRLFIEINVTTPGHYYINSAPLNGVTLSGEGVLDIGPQAVELVGHGIPVSAGAFPLSVSYDGTECNSIYLTFQ